MAVQRLPLWTGERRQCVSIVGETAATEADVLAGTGRCWTGICFMGLTLDELAEITRMHTKRTVTVLRDLAPETFHELLRHANDPGRRYVINFSRDPIFGAGGGHHSPIGGYLEDEDLVFVLDVNREFSAVAGRTLTPVLGYEHV